MRHCRIALSTVALAAAVASASSAAAAESRPFTAADATAGRALYLQECAGCHGDRGDGRGPAADFIDPKPRNLLTGPFKLRSTAAGQPPASADILRVIETGIPGTAMPSFAFLSAEERKRIAAHVLKLADILDENEPEAIAIDPASAPPATAESVARGKQLFADAGCANCHGESGKGDGPTAAQMKDSEGRPVRPRDFTDGRFRGGATRADLYLRLSTGMDGTPMPAYADVLEPADRWAVVDYVQTLVQPAVAPPLPGDPIEAGRVVAAKYSCRGCHVLDDGVGGNVGPDLRVSGEKLNPAWVKRFLADPRAVGKIYPWRPHRMPKLALSAEETTAMANYLAAIGKHAGAAFAKPDASTFPAAKVGAGKTLFVVTCAQCHSLGKVVETLPVNQQGPDLIHVGDRIDFEWAKRWITDPKKIDPKTRMTIPQLTPDQIDDVRMFIWKAAESQPSAAAATSPRDTGVLAQR